MEKHTDIIDQASKREYEMTVDAIESIRSLVPQERNESELDDYECEICGATETTGFPRARYLKGYNLCVNCQSLIERKAKLYAKKTKYNDWG